MALFCQMFANVQHNISVKNARVLRPGKSSGDLRTEKRLDLLKKSLPARVARQDDVIAAFQAGQVIFGENYVQEFIGKAQEVAEPVEWHFIGHLQRNKAKIVAPVASVVHTVDSARLAEELGKRAGASLPVLVEVNVGGEDQKSGCRAAELGAVLDAVEKETTLRLRGLMTVPPLSDDPLTSRPFFEQLVAIRSEHGGPQRLPDLSMGMSHDLEEAIRAGATIVRVGTAIFGARS